MGSVCLVGLTLSNWLCCTLCCIASFSKHGSHDTEEYAATPALLAYLAVRFWATQVNALHHSVAQHCIALHIHSRAQHSTAQHSTAQHSTAQHCTALHKLPCNIDCAHPVTAYHTYTCPCREMLSISVHQHQAREVSCCKHHTHFVHVIHC